jgi:hypothetical protein
MTDSSPERDDTEQTAGISDDQLPEDLQPGEDNPLAVPLDPGETPDVDLNEPSGSYARQRAEDASGESGGS